MLELENWSDTNLSIELMTHTMMTIEEEREEEEEEKRRRIDLRSFLSIHLANHD